MKIKIRNSKDFYSGLIFIFFGNLALGKSLTSYSLGTAMEMGPGFFPLLVSALLVIIGLIISVHALMVVGDSIKNIWELWYPILILAGVMAFGIMIRPLGLVMAIFTLVIISRLESREIRLGEIIVLCIVLAVFAVGVFVYGLGLPLKVWFK